MEKAKEFQETSTSASLTMLKPLTVLITTNWKILRGGIWDHLTCLLRNLYLGQETTVGIGHGTIDWFQIGKGVCQGCRLSPCLFNFCAEYIMWTTTRRLPRAAEQLSLCTAILRLCGRVWRQCALEPVLYKRSHHTEKPTHHKRGASPCCKYRKNPCISEDPGQPKINTYIQLYRKRKLRPWEVRD